MPIEKILALQRVPIFAKVSVDEMRPLSEFTYTVTMTEGTTLFPASAAPTL